MTQDVPKFRECWQPIDSAHLKGSGKCSSLSYMDIFQVLFYQQDNFVSKKAAPKKNNTIFSLQNGISHCEICISFILHP
jgi:hypothetical protein